MSPQEAMRNNVTVLANATEASCAILKKIMGNSMSNAIDGKPVDDLYLETAVASKLHSKLIPYLQG